MISNILATALGRKQSSGQFITTLTVKAYGENHSHQLFTLDDSKAEGSSTPHFLCLPIHFVEDKILSLTNEHKYLNTI